MNPGGVTEIVYHFAGYLQLITETAKDRIIYEDGGIPVRPDDYVVELRDDVVRPDLEELKTDKTPDSPFVLPDSLKPLEIHASFLRPLKPFRDVEPEVDDPSVRLPSLKKPVVAGSAEFDLKISLIYRDGGDQQMFNALQLNSMEDDDLLGARPESHAANLHHVDIDAKLGQLIDQVEGQIPEELALPVSGSQVAAEFLALRDTAIKNGGDDDDNPHSIEPGYYVNGELTQPPEDKPAPDENATAPDPAIKGQWAELGGNVATNAALIVDIKEASNTMIVLGDYFKTNAIVQTNAYIDNDNVRLAGGESYAPIIGGNNAADNIAEFIQNDGVFPKMPVLHAGLQWNVTVVYGDFYDVNVVYQKNVLQDNDVAVQDTQYSHYEAYLGANEQLNMFELFSGEVKYDLIVVCGDFHAANLIFQYNVLLDQDVLKIAAGDASADATSQAASSGENELLNNAVIVGYGDNFFAVPEDDLDVILDALASRSTSLDPSLGWLVPGNGSGVLDVLYVTGNYYDINAIWQVNVIADVDTAIQYFGLPNPEDGETFAQNASTGGNQLTNDATIVDVGANNSLVAGDVYQDTILIQANLVTESNDKIIHGDPNTLVSEVIAFTGDDNTEVTETDLPVTGTDVNSDPMGSILT
jgi:hypothetical protein